MTLNYYFPCLLITATIILESNTIETYNYYFFYNFILDMYGTIASISSISQCTMTSILDKYFTTIIFLN
mgnify:FL=1